jgi:2',3'-cyclic-nucleotide 2'-phosphodiesterase (5'-nucleotidase family)
MAKKYFDVDADVSIYNSGGIRENIYKGDVTLGDVYAVYPFDNVLTILDIKGRDLRELVKSAASGSLPFGGKVKLVVSGGALKSATVDGQQIDDNKTYTVATIDYLANLGRYGLQNATNKRKSVDFIRDYFGEYFKYIADQNGGYIDGPLDDRITVK